MQASFDVALETSGERRVAVKIKGWERGERESGDTFTGLGEPA